MPRARVRKVFRCQAMERGKSVCAQKRTGEARHCGWPPHLFQFPDPSRMLRDHTPHQAHMFRLWKTWTRHPAMFSYTESLMRSPLTTWTHGSDSSHCSISSRDTRPCTIVLFMALMLGFLAYLEHTFLLITLLFLSTLKFTMKLWRTSLGKKDTLAHSHRQISRPSLSLSNPRPFLWFPNRASQEIPCSP